MQATTPPHHPTSPMVWADALATDHTLEAAVATCAATLGEAPEGGFDLLFVFASAQYDHLERLGQMLAQEIPHRHLIGCCGGGIIGAGREIEFSPALSVLAATLPGVDITPFHVDQDDLADVEQHGRGPSGWRTLVGVEPTTNPDFVLLADPFSMPVEALVEGLDYGYAGAKVVGGLASGGDSPGEHHLFLDGASLRSGAVGVALSGAICIDTVVAQGVRPIGPTYLVTGTKGDYLTHLNEQPIFEVLSELFDTLSETDRNLAQHTLLMGIAQRAEDNTPSHGDFLIRNLVGADEARQALLVAAPIREGQFVRLHVRDASSSSEDLDTLLGHFTRHHHSPTRGALMFSCMGRGRGLYGRAHHDSERLRQAVGPTPLGGFFCNGEIGPVADTTYIHGYTNAIALFSAPTGTVP